ncbi:PhzF family phenazine biosynthesis protein [Planctomycetes bacterium K23_9]|uniref:PhzF family phenazine biosynthesis protein n=1 Tax=Stieleria marina TaxID=1930275 RepID=UPI00119F1DA7
MTDSLPIWQVDAFANAPFTGNPAAVCLLPQYPSDQWMQNVAAEMNLAETAFVVPTDDAEVFHLRWFTPAIEVDLCGHATIAAAHVLFQQNKVGTDAVIRFQTRSGELACRAVSNPTASLDQSSSNSGEVWIAVDFPVTASINRVEDSVCAQLQAALGVPAIEVRKTIYDIMVVLRDAASIRSLTPNLHLLAQIDTRGVMVTAPGDIEGVDFVSRFFAPQSGIDEDPVTGSAHCCLAPYWGQRLGKSVLAGYQASPRGGTVYCEVVGDRVKLSGHAVTVMSGQLLVAPE